MTCNWIFLFKYRSAGNTFASGCFLTLVHTLYMKDDNRNINIPQKIDSTVNFATPNCSNLQGFQRKHPKSWKPSGSQCRQTKPTKPHSWPLDANTLGNKQNQIGHGQDQVAPSLLSQHYVWWESHESRTKPLQLLFQYCK